MRVALLIDRWQPRRGGAEVAMEALAEHLVASGDEVLAFGRVGPGQGESTAAQFHRVRPWLARPTRGLRERALGRALAGAAARAKVDVTVGVRHLEEVDVLWLHGGCHAVTQEARYRARNAGHLPEGGLRLRGRHRAFGLLEARALNGGARVVVCPSSLVRDELAARYPGSEPRLIVVPNGVDQERFHPREREAAQRRLRTQLAVPMGTPLLCLPARNPELKGFPALLAALAPLQHLPWTLVLSGPRRPGRWRKLADRRGLAARVKVVRDLPALDLAAGADLCVLPTWRDTSGLVILEALAAGTPVLTTRMAGAAEVLHDPRSGRVLNSPNARADWTRELAESIAAVGTAGGQGIDPQGPRNAVGDRKIKDWLGRMAAVCHGVQLG